MPDLHLYNRNYYGILALPLPGTGAPKPTQDEIKKAYRASLLRWHPDKGHRGGIPPDTTATRNGTTEQGNYSTPRSTEISATANKDAESGKRLGPTVDEIKMAYHILSDPKKRAEYDKEMTLLLLGGGERGGGLGGNDSGDLAQQRLFQFASGASFLGHEQSFDQSPCYRCAPSAGAATAAHACISAPCAHAPSQRGGLGAVRLGDSVPEVVDLDDLVQEDSGTGDGLTWSRSCRCGVQKGFIITEAQLANEADAGGAEVIVQCKGCSLWLKVEFGVIEEEDQDE